MPRDLHELRTNGSISPSVRPFVHDGEQECRELTQRVGDGGVVRLDRGDLEAVAPRPDADLLARADLALAQDQSELEGVARLRGQGCLGFDQAGQAEVASARFVEPRQGGVGRRSQLRRDVFEQL